MLNKPIIAVGGSSGKTTTKEMIASILSRKWRILKSLGNWNARVATIRNAKRITPAHRAAVLEFGMTRLGDLRRHCRYLQPNIAVITMVGTAHIGNFGGNVARLANAKSDLIRYMKQTGTLVINADDHNSKLLDIKHFKGKIIRVGITSEEADYRAHNISYATGGMSFSVKLNGTEHRFFIPIYGTHNVYNALFAIAVADHLGFSSEHIRTGLRHYRKIGRRMTVYRLKNGIRLIDDSYNANPNSVKAAVDVLTHIGKSPKVVVLGGMLELGAFSHKGQNEVGHYVANKKVDYLFTYGDKAKQVSKAAVAAGLAPNHVIHSNDRGYLHRTLVPRIGQSSTILVKGSNKVQMYKTVRYIKARFKSK
ncbi:MAG: UDP-N-acetylmuramoyl-tripeptide--D-alanyl-D-alanine ligase [Chitinophagales bacterium]